MDLYKLKALIFVAEMNSITSAANALNLSQSAVSQQLKELERHLDLRLIDRSQRPVSLTRDGAELVKTARQMIGIWTNFIESRQEKEFSGQLVFGYVRSALTNVLAQAIRLLRDEYPQVTIRLVNTGGVSKHLAQLVAQGEIDASLGVGPLPLPKNDKNLFSSGKERTS